MSKPVVMVPVYCGGEEFEPCLASIRATADCFDRFFISCNGPQAAEDARRARTALVGLGDQVVILRTERTLAFIPHFSFYVQRMRELGVSDDTWVMMLQHDDWLIGDKVRELTQAGSRWALEPGNLYLGPWNVYWEPTVEQRGGIDHVEPELISSLYDIERTSMPVGDWVARQLTQPYYINTTGAIAQFQHWRSIASARPAKPGGMRFEMTLASSRGIFAVRQFSAPLVGVMARPDSERERYSSLAKRKDDAHFLYWAGRNWARHPSHAWPTIRVAPGLVARSIAHGIKRTKRLN